MSSGWERIRVRVETKESFEPPSATDDAQDTRTISTHILNTSTGQAAENVPITLYRLTHNDQWQELKQAATNSDGRCAQLLDYAEFQSGIYKLKFNTESYFNALEAPTFYPFIEIIVKCLRGQHYHIPLLLSNYGYTTYRGT